MKFTVAKEHRDFFRKYFRIEFTHLLSKKECDQLMAERLNVLSERLKTSKANMKSTSPSSQFMAGFDLWRANPLLKKVILQKNLAQISADLLEARSLRIGYDQLIPSLPSTTAAIQDDPYQMWLGQTSSLQEICSIQGVVSGLILCIKAPQDALSIAESEIKTATEAPSLFSTTLGNGVYFTADSPLDFSDLAARSGYAYLLITYAKNTSVYCKKENDPHTNAFRQLGYNFGDRLSDRHHPLIIF